MFKTYLIPKLTFHRLLPPHQAPAQSVAKMSGAVLMPWEMVPGMRWRRRIKSDWKNMSHMSMCPIICIHMLHDGIWIHLYIGEIIETPMFSRTKNHQSSWVLSHVFYSVKSLFSHVLCIKIHEKNELVHPLSLPDPFPRKSHGNPPEDFFGGLKKNWDNSWSSIIYGN